MRITAKGQVTIPPEIREKAGLSPQTEVTVEYDGVGVRIVRVAPKEKSRGAELIARLAGSGDVEMSTDEIMTLTRGE